MTRRPTKGPLRSKNQPAKSAALVEKLATIKSHYNEQARRDHEVHVFADLLARKLRRELVGTWYADNLRVVVDLTEPVGDAKIGLELLCGNEWAADVVDIVDFKARDELMRLFYSRPHLCVGYGGLHRLKGNA